MGTYPSVLAWKIPWTEEPGRLSQVHGATQSQTWLKCLNTHTLRKMRGRIKTITYENRSWERKKEMQRERTHVKVQRVCTCMYRVLASCFIPGTPYTSCTRFLHKNSSLWYFCRICERSQMRKKKKMRKLSKWNQPQTALAPEDFIDDWGQVFKIWLIPMFSLFSID